MSDDAQGEAETVWIALNAGSATQRTFHTRACIHCPDADRRTERDRATLEAWGYTQCAYCAGEHTSNDADPDTDRDRRRALRYRIQTAADDDPIQEALPDD